MLAGNSLGQAGAALGGITESLLLRAVLAARIPWVLEVSLSEKNSIEDRRGVDAVIRTDVGSFSIQVKSTARAGRLFQRLRKARSAIVMIISPGESESSVVRKFETQIGGPRKKILESRRMKIGQER